MIDKDKLYNNQDKYLDVKDSKDFDKHFKTWNFYDYEKELTNRGEKWIINPGDLILYEEFKSDNKVCYPKIGIFINYSILDMAGALEISPLRRTWEYNKKYSYVHNNMEYQHTYSTLNSRIVEYIQWGDYLMIYGIFSELPKWKELKAYYERTWWFKKSKEEIRDIKLNSIL